ncbi:protein S100-A16 [Gouania willdenowi]|uniref:Protein S100-A16-like n=1 Tax=Gouania willdenowi TaxID=441366 RepID=A0A8C5GCG8_GOUWI|nr:protein S100-A16-like [Gouania willdenowi]
MESAIKTLVTTFISSSKGKENLDSKGFKNLVEKQFSSILEDANSADKVKEMQQGLDANADGKVSFGEYLTLVGYLAQSMSDRKTAAAAQSD